MKILKITILIAVACSIAVIVYSMQGPANIDFNECSSKSDGDPYKRSGSMNKCMTEKGYKLEGNAGTSDAFTPSKWKKLN